MEFARDRTQLSAFCADRRYELSSWWSFIAYLILAIAVLPAIPSLFFFLPPLAVLLVIQSLVEVVIAWPMMGWPTPLQFRAWCEGMLIGYSACAMTCLLTGHTLRLFNQSLAYRFPAWLFVLTAVEAGLVQWWVMRRRNRQWQLGLQARPLARGLIAAKLFIAIPWGLYLYAPYWAY